MNAKTKQTLENASVLWIACLLVLSGCESLSGLKEKKVGAIDGESGSGNTDSGSGSGTDPGGSGNGGGAEEITSKIHLMDAAQTRAQFLDFFPTPIATTAVGEDITPKFDVLGGPCDGRASRVDGVLPIASGDLRNLNFYHQRHTECRNDQPKHLSRGPAMPAPSVGRMAYLIRTCNRILQTDTGVTSAVGVVMSGSYTPTTVPAFSELAAQQAFSYFYLRDEMGPALGTQVMALASQASANETTNNLKNLRAWEAVLYTFCTDPGLWVL
jgi:hypothetical protein